MHGVRVTGSDATGTERSYDFTLRVLARTCDQLPASSLIAGDYNLQVNAACRNLIGIGFKKVRVQVLGPNQKIYGWEVRTPSECANPTPNEPTAVLTCEVKPDGRVCFHLDVQPPPVAGDHVLVVLQRADGSAMSGQTFDTTVPSGTQAPCAASGP